ncbi:MAG: permease-like cell division protein FtsX [Bacillota bacterium]|nr:permease-like cell division protein FtsX [Bacillota bacterium]
MKNNNVTYVISQGFHFFFANKVMSLASVCVLAACLLITSNFFLITLNLQRNIKAIEDKNEVSLFVEDKATDADVQNIKSQLSSIDNIKNIEYKSKQQALEEYKSKFTDQKVLFNDLENDNPLPAYFKVTMNDITKFNDTLSKLRQVTHISSIRSQEDIVDAIIKTGSVIKNVSMWIMIIMLIASLFIIVNTIRLAFFHYRRQINIMKYIGATNWFIRWPFIVEGTIIGIISGLISFGLQWYAYIYAFQSIASSLSFVVVIPFTSVAPTLALAFLCVGIVIGVVGSAISIGRYLRV